eukprot:1631616-Pyramimonas_sp.AAC.1
MTTHITEPHISTSISARPQPRELPTTPPLILSIAQTPIAVSLVTRLTSRLRRAPVPRLTDRRLSTALGETATCDDNVTPPRCTDREV